MFIVVLISADLQEEEIISVSNYEGQKLMQQQSSVEKLGKSNTAKSHRRKTQRGYSRGESGSGRKKRIGEITLLLASRYRTGYKSCCL